MASWILTGSVSVPLYGPTLQGLRAQQIGDSNPRRSRIEMIDEGGWEEATHTVDPSCINSKQYRHT